MGTSVHERKRQKEREIKREDFHNRNIGFKG